MVAESFSRLMGICFGYVTIVSEQEDAATLWRRKDEGEWMGVEVRAFCERWGWGGRWRMKKGKRRTTPLLTVGEGIWRNKVGWGRREGTKTETGNG
jgi:hypothetical protein